MGNVFRNPQHQKCNAAKSKSPSKLIDDVVFELFADIKKKNNTYELICPNQDSVKFKIDENIHLNSLITCGMTGTEILNKIIEIADRLKKNIELTDTSYKKFETIKCSYSLSHFYILLHGESWYNKFGFKSKTHHADKLHNEKIRNLPLHKFIQMATDTYIKKELIELEYDADVMISNPHLYIDELEQYESVDSYIFIKREALLRTILLDVDEFITEFGTFDENTKVSRIVSEIFTNFIEIDHPTTCNRKIQLLKQFIDSSRHVLKYSKGLIREPKKNRGTRKRTN